MPSADRPPLWGVPFAVKDNIDVEGFPTTAACKAFSYQPKESAPAVQALLDAGAQKSKFGCPFSILKISYKPVIMPVGGNAKMHTHQRLGVEPCSILFLMSVQHIFTAKSCSSANQPNQSDVGALTSCIHAIDLSCC